MSEHTFQKTSICLPLLVAPPGPAPKCGGHPHLIPEILRKAHSQQPVFYVSYASTAASPPLYILIIGTRPFTFASFQPLFPSFLHSSLCRTEMEQIKSKCLLLLRVAGRAWPVGVHQVSGGSGTYVKPRFIAPWDHLNTSKWKGENKGDDGKEVEDMPCHVCGPWYREPGLFKAVERRKREMKSTETFIINKWLQTWRMLICRGIRLLFIW